MLGMFVEVAPPPVAEVLVFGRRFFDEFFLMITSF